MIPREMAKIGLLMLNRGLWEEERILSEAWVKESTSPQVSMRNGVWYGYLWQTGRANIGNMLVEAFWASGNGGQYIIVIPDHGLVAVFTGGNYNSPLANQPWEILATNILPAFLHPAPLDTVSLTLEQLGQLAPIRHSWT
jgi:CubicO group peptidase (beta-lactamase class C family)